MECLRRAGSGRAGPVWVSADCSSFALLWMSGSLGATAPPSFLPSLHHFSLMCMAAAVRASGKQGNMCFIKISFISLLIKRLSLVIECLAPPPLALPGIDATFRYPAAVAAAAESWLEPFTLSKIVAVYAIKTNDY